MARMARHVPARELHLHLQAESGGSDNKNMSTTSGKTNDNVTFPTQKRDLIDASTVKDSLNALPGFKTSAAFFTFLRANLVLPPTSPHSAMSSNTSTPLLTPSASQTLLPPSPSPLSAPPTNAPDLSDVPPLTTFPLTKSEDRIHALKLIADSIAQQRQVASKAVIVHPISLALWVLVIGIIYQLLYKTPQDIGIVITTAGGISMSMLVAVRMLTGGYLTEAEKMKWEFLLNQETEEEDLLIGSKFGDEVIGALVLRLERPGGSGAGKKRVKNVKGGKGLIRAWTTKLRYRGKGIGTGLLEEAIKITRERLGKDAEVGFAADHANSTMLLPAVFNSIFKTREQKAIKMLEELDEGGKRKR